MSSQFFTNKDDNTLLAKFKGAFGENAHIAQFDVLVGYFWASGYFLLRPHLENLSQIRILVGIDVDKLTKAATQKGLEFSGASTEVLQQDYMQALKKEIENADYSSEHEKSIKQFIADIASKKVVLKAHPSKTIHAKLYIMRPEGYNEHQSGEVITGSSNLSAPGLGGSDNSNYEFNVLLRNYTDVKFATDEFEALWAEATDILHSNLQEVQDKSHLRDDITPFQLYIKLLIEYFGSEINFDPETIGDLPEGFKRLQYQLDAVEQGSQILKKHNGFFLSDVVGLGKTVIAIMIAKRFFLYNQRPHSPRTLIICPPAVKDNWQDTADKFDLNNVKIITNGSLQQITKENGTRSAKDYDLIIVDESHTFKNKDTDGYGHLQKICKHPCRDGEKKRVILVSATPMNNSPDDIKNQILLFQDSNDSSLDISITNYFYNIQKKYKALLKDKTTKNTDKLEAVMNDMRLDVLEPITVRRTRKDLLKYPAYENDLKKQGIAFPKIHPPEKLIYQLPPSVNQLYDKTIRIIANKNSPYEYGTYRKIEFLKEEHKQAYQRADFITQQLRGLMKTLLLKRLDSSFHAFNSSLKNFVRSCDLLLAMFKNDRIYISSEHDIQTLIEEGREDELIHQSNQDNNGEPNIKMYKASDFEEEFLTLLEKDYAILKPLQEEWQAVIEDKNEPDPKLTHFLEQLTQRITHKKNNPNGKVVIFSESKVTTEYLADKLIKQNYKTLAITSKNHKEKKQAIKENFDANLEANKQQNDYDIIIATETLAQGVNLHRANSIVNYDTPWNSTRLMQRIGRVNRIGSQSTDIYIYNFFPTEKIEGDINLKHRAQIKLQAFHNALGEDSQIYTTEEKVDNFGMFDETIKEEESITERFKYLHEIRQFKENNPDEFKTIDALPFKIRTAVRCLAHHIDNANSTLCFLRNDRHNAFYWVDNKNTIEDLGFFKAIKYFERYKKQPPKSLPSNHYTQIRQSIQHFISTETGKIIEQKVPKLGPIPQRAIGYIKSLQNLPLCTETEKKQLAEAIKWIQAGRYQKLPNDIDKKLKITKTANIALAKQLESVLKTISAYDNTGQSDKTEQDSPTKNRQIGKPQVVISQSYL